MINLLNWKTFLGVHTMKSCLLCFLQFLVEQGAEVDAKMSDGTTALMNAAARGRLCTSEVRHTLKL